MQQIIEDINLKQLQYNRPNIISLIDPLIRPYKIDKENINNQTRNVLFNTSKGVMNDKKNGLNHYLVYLRGIMDSKFNEMVMSESS